MPNIELTDDEFYWVCVAIENCKGGAERISQSDDIDDQLDAGLLINRWDTLQEKFPPSGIDFNKD